MQDVKDKTADIVESLEASKRDSRGKVKKAAEFLLGSNDYKARVDEAIGKESTRTRHFQNGNGFN